MNTDNFMSISERPFVPYMEFTSAQYLNITVGEKGFVTISLRDGSVKFENCEVDEAAKSFWNAVSLAFPAHRDAIMSLEMNRLK